MFTAPNTGSGLAQGTLTGDSDSGSTEELQSLPELHLISGEGAAREEARSTVWFGFTSTSALGKAHRGQSWLQGGRGEMMNTNTEPWGQLCPPRAALPSLETPRAPQLTSGKVRFAFPKDGTI